MTTPIQLTGTLTGKVEDATTTGSISVDGFVTDTIPNRGPNDTILLSLEGESANSATSVVSTYGGLVFTPNALDAPTLGTWTYYLNPTAAETIALGTNSPPTTETFTLTYITRDDDGNETNRYEADIEVTILGKNEAPTLSVSYDTGSAGTIDENVDPDDPQENKVMGINFTANDVDVGDNLTYHIKDGTGKDIFTINQDGEIRLKSGQSLDYEATNSYTLDIVVRDPDGLESDSVEVTIEIGNKLEINNNILFAPIFIDENDTSLSFTVTPVEARFESSPFPWITDPVKVGTIYSIDSGGDGLFTIDRTSGIVTLTGALDYETKEQYEVVVRADVGDEHATTTLTINVRDKYEVPTIRGVIDAIIAENDADAVLGIITVGGDIVTGLDEDDFTITGEHSEKFRVAKNANGEFQLKLTSALDFEAVRDNADDTEADFDLQITITDDRGNSATQTINVNVTDINDNAPVLVANQARVSLAEQVATAAVDTGITFTASDADANTSFSASDFTVSGDDRFEVVANGNNWKLQLKADRWLDYRVPDDRSIDLTVKVNDGVHDSEDIAVTVNVTDVANNAPIYTSGTGSYNSLGRILEQTATSSAHTGYFFWVSDADVGTTFTSDSFTITGADGNVDDRFEIRAEVSYWRLYLKAGKTLDSDNVAHRLIDLTITVNDGVNVTQGTATIKTIRRIDGTEDSEVIQGSSAFEDIYGYGGDDIIYAGAGDDRIFESSGDGTLYGGAGDDWLRGGNDDYTLYGGAGDDSVVADDGEDTLYGGAGNDRLAGHGDADTYYGGAGIDYFWTKGGNDLFYLDIANAKVGNINGDIVSHFSRGGTNGVDRILIEVSKADKSTIDGLTTNQAKLNKLMELADIRWETAHENLNHEGTYATSYSDSGRVRNTVIYDTRGTSRTDDDIILMVLEDFTYNLTFDMFHIVVKDVVTGTSRGETLSGTGRNSTINAGRGHDTIYGDAGDDIIRGGYHNDILYGGEDNDILYGGNNNDTLHGEGGIDILYGNSGRDRFVLDIVNAGVPDVDIVADFSRSGNGGTDVIRVDTTNGNEVSFAALGLYVKHGASKALTGHETDENHASTMDTVIYKIMGQADTASNRETDDVALMIIEDYTITDSVSDFATMVEVV